MINLSGGLFVAAAGIGQGLGHKVPRLGFFFPHLCVKILQDFNKGDILCVVLCF
jgi:hypothetical protein